MSVAFQTLDKSLSGVSPFDRIQDLSQLGQLLRDVRKSYGHDLERIANELRLKRAFLEALEEGNWNLLPGETYGRGYIRQYAEYLGLSADEAAAACQRIQGKVDSKLRYLDIVSSQETPKRGTLWVSLLALAGILLAVLWYQSPSKPQPAPLVPPPEMTDTPAPSAPVTAIMPALRHNLHASCLNIPSKVILPCWPQPQPRSLLLTGETVYPIWEGAW